MVWGVEAARSGTVYCYWGLGLLNLHSMLRVSEGAGLEDESAYSFRGQMLSLLPFVSERGLPEFQEKSRWSRIQEIP